MLGHEFVHLNIEQVYGVSLNLILSSLTEFIFLHYFVQAAFLRVFQLGRMRIDFVGTQSGAMI